jgi:putative membrane protein
MAEVVLSQLALRKSKNQSVRMIAQTLIKEHSDAQIQVQAAATRKGVRLPMMLSPTHQAVQQQLNRASGANFDRMFMANQVDDHENTIALFANEVAMGGDDDAKALAGALLPNIVGHTAMIYNVARQVGAPGIELRPPAPPTPPGVTPTPMSAMAGMTMTPGTTMSGTGTTGMPMTHTPSQ